MFNYLKRANKRALMLLPLFALTALLSDFFWFLYLTMDRANQYMFDWAWQEQE